MFKDFLIRKMLSKQLQGLPKDQQERILTAIKENPELFNKIGKEIKEEMKKGKPQMSATMEVMKKYQTELQKIMR